jgi:hypothetical protein
MDRNQAKDWILVPQGAEKRAIDRGLKRVRDYKPLVLGIPIGTRSLRQSLQQWQASVSFPKDYPKRILLMGLCGSLSPQFQVGDIVIYRDCCYAIDGSQPQIKSCDREFTSQLQKKCGDRAKTVTQLTSDRLIWSAQEKQRLGKLNKADAIDMEGFAALEVITTIFTESTPKIGMIRVVSDACDRDIPNLEGAIDSSGSLQPLPLAIGFLKQPSAAIRLIKDSLTALRVLEQLTTKLFGK